jgi:hypothetical protein
VATIKAMVTLARMEPLSADAIMQALRHDDPQLALQNASTKNNTVYIDIDGHALSVTFVPEPIPAARLEDAAASSLLWPQALEVLGAHPMHLAVAVSGTAPGDVIAQARALTQVSAALGAAFPSAHGVLWSGADLLVPMPLFRQLAQTLMPKGPPIHLWVKFHAGLNDAGQACGYTRGLAALGLMDVEVEASPESVNDLGRRLESIAGYLLANGPVVHDGDRLGEPGGAVVRVAYGASVFGNDYPVMRLDYGNGKKPFWKIW